MHDLEHRGRQIAGIQHNRFARLKIDLHTVFFAQIVDALHECFYIVIVARDMVAAAQIEPLHALHIFAEALLKRRDRAHQIVRILLAQGVEMETVDTAQQVGLEVFQRDAQTRGRAAGIVHCVLGRLGRAFGVEAQAAALARRAGQAAVRLPLVEGVEHNMVGIVQQLLKFALRIGGGVDVGLAAEFLMAEAGLI